ncbi:hypothetical protein V2J09_007022 [Rumex salicifolius]
MPLSRYLVRNEYGLADPDLYKVADKDDPEALLEGVAMAGLVGILRQLGDLAEFAAEMFHDLHEEVMATAARGHALIARVQQLEAEFPSVENTLLSQTTHIPFLYNSGIDWHPNIRMDENLVTQGDMPRFVMDSYEECRGPPRLFLLDKFDVAGAGACLKRYTDPSFCKVESAEFSNKKSEGQREKRIRKIKRRGSVWRNGDTPEVFPSSHAKLHQLLLEERIETGANDPERRVKLKKRPLDGFTREDRLKSYMQKFMDTYSSDTKAVREISLDLVPVNVGSYNDNCHSGLEIVKYDTFSPSPEPFYKDKAAYSSFNIPEVVKPSLSELNDVTNDRVTEIPGSNNGDDADNLTVSDKDASDEDLAAATGSKSGGSVGEYNVDDIASEIDNYVDALATLESETETDSDSKTKRDQRSRNGMKKMIDSDGSEDKPQQNLILDNHSRGNSTISDDCTLLKKETDIFSSSDNVSNSADDATAKFSSAGPVNSIADYDKSVTREAQGNNTEEHVASDVTENMGVVNAEFKELPWISVKVGSALTKTDKMIEQTDQESAGQAVVNAVPDDGYDHRMSVGISPLLEMADASSDSSSDVSLGHILMTEETSSHHQPEFSRDGQSTSLNETKSSSASSSVNSINYLRQPVEATSDALALHQKSSVSVLDFPEPVYTPCEDNDLSQINDKSSDDQPLLSGVLQDHDQPKDNDLELVEQMVSLATDTDVTVESRVSIAADSENLCVPAVEPLSSGYFEYTEQLEFSSSENIVAHSVDESSDWTVQEPTVDKTNMNGDDSSNSDLVVNPSQVNSQSDQVPDVPDASLHFDSSSIANMEAVSMSDSVDEVKSNLSLDDFRNLDHGIATYQDQSGPAPVSSSDAHSVEASEPLQAEGDAISFVDTNEKDADAAISSQTVTAECPPEHSTEVKDDLDLTHSVQTKVSRARFDCLEVENTETKRQSISSVLDCSSTGYEESLCIGEDPYLNCKGSQTQSLQAEAEVDLQNPVTFGTDEFVNSDSTAIETSSVDNARETWLEDSQTSAYPISPDEAPLSSVECDQHVIETQLTLDKTIDMQGAEITEKSYNAMEGTSQPLEYAEQILHSKDGENEKRTNPISVFSLCAPQSLAADLSIQSGDYDVESQLVEGEPSALSVSVSSSREPLVADMLAQSADHKVQTTWPAMEQSAAGSSTNLLPVEAQGSLKCENPGQTMNLSQASPPLFGISPNPAHVTPGDMPPLPPLPPIQWRLGKNQQTPLAFGGLMQNPFGTPQSSVQLETSDNAGLRYQNSSRAQHLNPFVSSSGEGANFQDAARYSDGYLQQPTYSMLPVTNMSHEDGQQHNITLDYRHDPQISTASQNDLTVSASGTQLDNFSFEPLESGLMTDDAISRSPALFEEVIKKETTVADDQFEHNFSPAELETAVVNEQPEHNSEVATTSAQFEPLIPMHYGNQLSHGFSDPEAQGIWSTDVYSARKPENVNGSLQKKIQRPRNPLIDAVVAVDKSKLRKVGEMVKPQDKPEAETREQHLPQLRKVGKRVKPQDKPEGEVREQPLPQLRKVGQRVKPQDAVKAEGSSQNFPQLRKTFERVKRQDLPSVGRSTQQLPQLRKVEKRTKPQDEPKAQDETQSLPPLRGVGEKVKSQEESQVENKDWLEQIRNQSFNLKRAATSRPNIQGRQTNLKVAAILEKASMIRQAMAGNDDDSDGWIGLTKD